MAPTRDTRETSSLSRAELTAEHIAGLARTAGAGARLGSREDLRVSSGVSVGTLHEALRLLQSTGEIYVRTGPGGGVFAGESSALSDLVRSLHGQDFAEPLFPQTVRVLQALRPLIFADAIDNVSDATTQLLRERVAVLDAARSGELRDCVRASLEVFATIVSIPPAGILRTVAASVLRAQMDTLRGLSGAIDPRWSRDADGHVEVVTHMVEAIVGANLGGALGHASDPRFMALFESIADRAHP